MKIKNASAYQLLLAGLLALPLLPAQAAAAATELELEAHPALPPGGPAAGRPAGDEARSGAMSGVPYGCDNGRAQGPRFGPAAEPHALLGSEHGHPPFGEAALGPRPPLLHGVELSDAQQDKVFAILHAEAPYLREQGKAAAKAGEALHAMARADQYDDAKAIALAKEAATAMANITLQHVRTEQKLLAILTPEQRKKLAERAMPPLRRP